MAACVLAGLPFSSDHIQHLLAVHALGGGFIVKKIWILAEKGTEGKTDDKWLRFFDNKNIATDLRDALIERGAENLILIEKYYLQTTQQTAPF
jgi:hypothetical protein